MYRRNPYAAKSFLGSQPIHDPRVAIALARFLPDDLVSAIRDGPGKDVIASLEQTTEAPEVVLTPAMAASVYAHLYTMVAFLYHE
jgi:DnaJ family protein C protein 13